jgi:hypothetical protein
MSENDPATRQRAEDLIHQIAKVGADIQRAFTAEGLLDAIRRAFAPLSRPDPDTFTVHCDPPDDYLATQTWHPPIGIGLPSWDAPEASDTAPSPIRESMRGLAGSSEFYDLLVIVAILHHRKQLDYTAGLAKDDPFANFKVSARMAGCTVEQAIKLHIGNKVGRIESLENQHTRQNEPLEDSYLDLAVYCLLLLAWKKSQAKSTTSPEGVV